MAQDIIYTIIQCVALVVFFLIGKFVIPVLKKNVSEDTMSELKDFIDIYVKGIEQTTKEANAGEEKLATVTKMVTNKANELGLKVSDEDIRLLIEASVYALNEGTKTTTTVKVEN